MKTIRRYISSSGAISDLLIEEIGHAGYLQLVEESLDILKQSIGNVIDENEYAAISQLIESYELTLSGDRPQVVLQLEEDTEYLSNCKVLAKHNILPSRKAPRKYRSEVSRYKDLWRNKLPISSYIGLLKLLPFKYDSITEGKDETIKWD